VQDRDVVVRHELREVVNHTRHLVCSQMVNWGGGRKSIVVGMIIGWSSVGRSSSVVAPIPFNPPDPPSIHPHTEREKHTTCTAPPETNK
jgi:hypothetical protein